MQIHSLLVLFLSIITTPALSNHCFEVEGKDPYCPTHPDQIDDVVEGGIRAYVDYWKDIVENFEGLTPQQRVDLIEQIQLGPIGQ